MDSTPDPVLALCDRIVADISKLVAQINAMQLEYGNLRRDTASTLADSTPPERDRYVTPQGDRRERAVACRRCHMPTWALDRTCDSCYQKATVSEV